MRHKILIADDEQDIVEFIEYNLLKAGYEVFTANNSKQVFEILETETPELIVLDIMMPEMSGIEIAKKIKLQKRLENCAIFFLTAMTEEQIEVDAFALGADDFIIKPVKPQAFITRVNKLFDKKIKKNKEEDIIEIGKHIINPNNYTVTDQKGQPTILPRKEFKIIHFLAKNANKIYNREQILESIWENDTHVMGRTVDVHIRKIREKIGPEVIETLKGVGYMVRK